MCRIQDCDPWKLYSFKIVKARRAHKCFECDRTISPGERYHRASALDPDGDRWQSYKLCAHCDAASEWLMVVCNGYLYGGIGEELQEHWDEEIELRSIGLARLIHGRERAWQRTKYATGLMEVPTWAGQVAKKTMLYVHERDRVYRDVYSVRTQLSIERSNREWREYRARREAERRQAG